jgi:hypothetical protein
MLNQLTWCPMWRGWYGSDPTAVKSFRMSKLDGLKVENGGWKFDFYRSNVKKTDVINCWCVCGGSGEATGGAGGARAPLPPPAPWSPTGAPLGCRCKEKRVWRRKALAAPPTSVVAGIATVWWGLGGYSWVLVRRSLADDRAHFISSPVLASNSNVPVGNAPSPAPPSVSHCLYLDYSEAWISIQSKKLMHRKLHRSGSIFEQKHAQIGPRGDRRWTQDLLTSLHIVQKQFWYTKRLKFPSKALASDA